MVTLGKKHSAPTEMEILKLEILSREFSSHRFSLKYLISILVWPCRKINSTAIIKIQILTIKNQIQLANPQYLCLYFKESSFQYAVSSFGLEKVGISSLSMINTTCRTQTQGYTQDKAGHSTPKPLLNPGNPAMAPGLGTHSQDVKSPSRAHPAPRPASRSPRTSPSLCKGLWRA